MSRYTVRVVMPVSRAISATGTPASVLPFE